MGLNKIICIDEDPNEQTDYELGAKQPLDEMGHQL